MPTVHYVVEKSADHQWRWTVFVNNKKIAGGDGYVSEADAQQVALVEAERQRRLFVRMPFKTT